MASSAGLVYPTPVFDQREIPMRGGFVRVTDLLLRGDNERLEVHLAQFRQINDRQPSPDELLSLMMSTTPLLGLDDDDQFKIKPLGRSIANNGVRKPPVIDLDGTLLDGNRRVAACLWALGEDGFSAEQRARAEWVFVLQLTEYSNSDHRHRVVVFSQLRGRLEGDWPEIRQGPQGFRGLAGDALPGARSPSTARTAELKKELSKRFAAGPRTDIVNRYIKMVQEADRFEEHQVEDRRNDPYEVKHRASEYFQYFDEVSPRARTMASPPPSEPTMSYAAWSTTCSFSRSSSPSIRCATSGTSPMTNRPSKTCARPATNEIRMTRARKN